MSSSSPCLLRPVAALTNWNRARRFAVPTAASGRTCRLKPRTSLHRSWCGQWPHLQTETAHVASPERLRPLALSADWNCAWRLGSFCCSPWLHIGSWNRSHNSCPVSLAPMASIIFRGNVSSQGSLRRCKWYCLTLNPHDDLNALPLDLMTWKISGYRCHGKIVPECRHLSMPLESHCT